MIYPIRNLVIDVQEAWVGSREMDKEHRQAYLQAIDDSIQRLRACGIPTMRITGCDHAQQLHPATVAWSSSSVPALRSPDLLEKTKLAGFAVYEDEDIFTKRFFNGFTDIKDVQADERLAEYIKTERFDGTNVLNSNGQIENVIFGGVTLGQRLQELGTEHVTIMGGMAGFCIAQNALAAILRDLRTTVFCNRLAGWRDWPDEKYDKAVYYADNPPFHEKEVRDALNGIASNPTSRGYALSQQMVITNAIAQIKFTNFEDFVTGLNPGAPAGHNPPPAAYSPKPR